MHSKRSLEGYLLIENRHAPGIDADWARKSGKDPIGAGMQGIMETSTITCSHCQKQMIVQPLRTRERPYCRKCDHYMCDECALVSKLNGGECLPMKAVFDIQSEHLHTLGKG